MTLRMLCAGLLAMLLSGCGDDRSAEAPPPDQPKTFGGAVGQSYRDALDGARQTTDDINRQMQEQDERMRALRE